MNGKISFISMNNHFPNYHLLIKITLMNFLISFQLIEMLKADAITSSVASSEHCNGGL
jgi:hypothetical protein